MPPQCAAALEASPSLYSFWVRGGEVSRGYTIQNVVHASSLLPLFPFLLRGGMGGAGRGRRGAGCIPRCRLESPGAARAFNARSGGCGPLYHSPSQHRAGERPGGLITTTRGDQHVMTLTPLFIPQSSGTCAGGWPSKPSPAHTSPQKPRRFSPLPSLVRGASAALVSSLPSPSVVSDGGGGLREESEATGDPIWRILSPRCFKRAKQEVGFIPHSSLRPPILRRKSGGVVVVCGSDAVHDAA